MRQPRSYVVRVYRRGFRTLGGIVEDTVTGAQRPFRDADELIALLTRPLRRGSPSRTNPDVMQRTEAEER